MSNKVRKENTHKVLKIIISQPGCTTVKIHTERVVFIPCIVELPEKENKAKFMYFTIYTSVVKIGLNFSKKLRK